jgi:hypothetical protein
VRSAEATVADAESALNDVGDADRSAILAAEGEVTAADDALELARLDEQWANEEAVAAAEKAAAALAAAEQELVDGESADPPLTEEDLAELRSAVAAAEEALPEATRNVERVAAEQASLVAQAETRLEVAKATLSELRSGPNTSGMRRQVSTAREELSAAREDLANLESELGTWLPAGELVFLDRLPVRVDQVSVARGSEISGSFLTVTGSVVTLRSAVSESDAALLEVGIEVQIENPEDDSVIPGVISAVADRPGTNGVATDRVYVEIEPEEIPEGIVGQNVRIVVPVSSTGGDVLAVPAAALYSTADGSTRVEVEDEDGSLRQVTVETGLAAGGLVEITPLDGEVVEGDMVVVGRGDGSGPGGEEADPGGEEEDAGDEEEDAGG